MSETIYTADSVILKELAPTAEKLLNRHLDRTIMWYPDDVIPYGNARSFTAEYEFKPEETGISDAASAALFVNLLTEDNLPNYFETISRTLGNNSPYAEWNNRWKAEEARHSIALRGLIITLRLLDHRKLEDARLHYMEHGRTPQPPNAPQLVIYAKLQEKATQISHRNTGKATNSPEATKVLGPISRDEGFHHEFYGDLSIAGFEIFPSEFVIAAYERVRNFEMPGAEITGFKQKAELIAKEGIYNLEIFKEEVLVPSMRAWDVENLTGLTDEAKEAQEALINYPVRLDRVIAHSKREHA